MLPKINKILYATGMGAGAPYVFRYALALARQHDAQIIAVSALEPLSTFAQSLVELHISHEQSAEIHSKAQIQAKEKLRERITRLCEKECGTDQQCTQRVNEILIEEGQPAQIILAAAREYAVDLIIMGAHRHTVIGDAMLGSTTHKVLHSAAQPVLVVRIPAGFHEQGF
ncbi:MAG: universal stress protein [Desulfuromonadales bacterium]|nr:universal stress protein [Desulfuromonadales bacterium]